MVACLRRGKKASRAGGSGHMSADLSETFPSEREKGKGRKKKKVLLLGPENQQVCSWEINNHLVPTAWPSNLTFAEAHAGRRSIAPGNVFLVIPLPRCCSLSFGRRQRS